ncbi:MAG: ATP-binding protein [Candidatus Thiodiazotropha taylori]|uniref:ATP-binding protein n=1 Tax=Candidatus Thiodiazotropha taylori TaxID=2792791 RepID=A0A9E4K8P4_9GAMM|nr:ATP-binding protein [Candidatus Thiodiazotropha taylori]MCW4255062.1 ATP-binding protein [Candidatus Thiodiazotropha taylori]
MSTDVLMEKWQPVLDHSDLDAIEHRDRKAVTAQVLENTEIALREEAGMLSESSLSGASFGGAWSGAGDNTTLNDTGRAGYDPIIISLVRRAMPQMMAFDLCGVQPMTAPTGLIFALRARYQDHNTSRDGAEAFYNEVFPNFSGTAFGANDPATHAANADRAGSTTNPFDPSRASNLAETANISGLATEDGTAVNQAPVNNPFTQPGTAGQGVMADNFDMNYDRSAGNRDTAVRGDANYDGSGTTGYGMTTRQGEGDNFREMSFTIERTAVEARTRALKSEYTMELVQDLKAVHGLDAEAELANILSTEILAEINREVIRTVITQGKWGAEGLTNNGEFDLMTDAQGRWSVERQKGLMLQLEKEANKIAFETRRGKGNILLCSANVASALTMAGLLDYTSGLQDNLNVDVTSGTFAGTLNGRMKVYVDPYATAGDYALVGYKGNNQMDAGMFYCPYVPLQMVRAVAQETFQPKIGFKTRYGMVSNPFAEGEYKDRADNHMGLAAVNSNTYYRKFRITNL